jgi:protein tyrosine/serine phosphatase
MTRKLPFALALGIVALMVGVPCWYANVQYRHYRNFAVVEPGILYRSGQLDQVGLQAVLRDYKIRTVISLRDGQKKLEQDEEAYCKANGIDFVRLPSLDMQDASLTESSLAEFRAIMSDEKRLPALIHCFAGIHRTGQFCAVYRLDRGWPLDKVYAEMIDRGYTILDTHKDVKKFLASYVPNPYPPK